MSQKNFRAEAVSDNLVVAEDPVGAGPAREQVVPGSAHQHVAVGATDDNVVARATRQPFAGLPGIRAGLGDHGVVHRNCGVRVEAVIAVTA